MMLSLWKVETTETRSLIVAFLEHLKKGESKADALRNAKLRMIGGRKNRPYYWAAFILVGQ